MECSPQSQSVRSYSIRSYSVLHWSSFSNNSNSQKRSFTQTDLNHMSCNPRMGGDNLGGWGKLNLTLYSFGFFSNSTGPASSSSSICCFLPPTFLSFSAFLAWLYQEERTLNSWKYCLYTVSTEYFPLTLFFSRRFSFKGKMPDYSSDCFLVGAFPLREKCPTIAVTVF